MKHADAAHTGTNRAHQRWMLSRMKDLILPGGDKAGMSKGQISRPSFVDFINGEELLFPKGLDFYQLLMEI